MESQGEEHVLPEAVGSRCEKPLFRAKWRTILIFGPPEQGQFPGPIRSIGLLYDTQHECFNTAERLLQPGVFSLLHRAQNEIRPLS
jgi:hypothetical protein